MTGGKEIGVNDEHNHYPAVFSVFSFNLSIRWLSFVNGNCSIKIKTEKFKFKAK